MRYLLGAIFALVLAVPPAAAQSNTPLGFLLEPFNPRAYQPAQYPPPQPYAGAPARPPYQAQPYPGAQAPAAAPTYQNSPYGPPRAAAVEPYQAPQPYQPGQAYQARQQYQPGQAVQTPPAYGAQQPYGARRAYNQYNQQDYSNQQPAQQQHRQRGGLFSWLGTPFGATPDESERATQATPASLQPATNEEYLHRRIVASPYSYEPGTIVIDTDQKFLYLTMEGGQALRYGVGVGRQGFEWNGTAVIGNKAEWPTWTPPAEMREREPWLPVSMEGGVENPLGARALYLHEGGKDTLYRIHGTNQPETIGQALSSGCIRMLNEDVMDLYQRVPIGTKVVVI